MGQGWWRHPHASRLGRLHSTTWFSGNDKRQGSRGFKKFSDFGKSSRQGNESSQTLVLLWFGAIREGRVMRDWSLLTSWTLDFRVFSRNMIRGLGGYECLGIFVIVWGGEGGWENRQIPPSSKKCMTSVEKKGVAQRDSTRGQKDLQSQKLARTLPMKPLNYLRASLSKAMVMPSLRPLL